MRTLLALAIALFPIASWPTPQSPREIALGHRVWVRALSDRVWVVRSISALGEFGDVESNAVLVAGGAGSVLIDTPATDEQTAPVLAWAAETLRRPVRHLVVTHSHADRMGGIGAARVRQIATYALGKTRALAREKGLEVPEHELGPEEHLVLSGVRLETWYPGPGHTVDNIVVWLPADGALVGGCLVKSAEARALGNVRESDPAQWASGIAALGRRYRNARTVIPGHGAAGGRELLVQTAALLEANADERARGAPAR